MDSLHEQRFRFVIVGLTEGMDYWAIIEGYRKLYSTRYPDIINLARFVAYNHTTHTGSFWWLLEEVGVVMSPMALPIRYDYVRRLHRRVFAVQQAILEQQPIPNVQDWEEIEKLLRKLQNYSGGLKVTNPAPAPPPPALVRPSLDDLPLIGVDPIELGYFDL